MFLILMECIVLHVTQVSVDKSEVFEKNFKVDKFRRSFNLVHLYTHINNFYMCLGDTRKWDIPHYY